MFKDCDLNQYEFTIEQPCRAREKKVQYCFHSVSYRPPYVMPPVGRQWKRMCVSAGCIDMDSPACLCIFPLLEFTINRVNKTKNPTQKIHVPELFFLRPQWPCMVTHTCTEVQGSHARRGASFNRAATKSFAVIDKKKDTGMTFLVVVLFGSDPSPFQGATALSVFHPSFSIFAPRRVSTREGAFPETR